MERLNSLAIGQNAAGFAFESPTQISAEIDTISTIDWDLRLTEFADASLQQTSAYGSVNWGKRQISRLVLKRDAVIIAMAQVRVMKMPALPIGVAYLRWAPICRSRKGGWDEQAFNSAIASLKHEYSVKRGLLLRLIPNVFVDDDFAPAIERELLTQGFSHSQYLAPYCTMRLDLLRSLEDLRKGLGQRWRNKLKHAEKGGFKVSVGTNDLLFDRFKLAYDEMMSRKQFDTTVSVTNYARIQSILPQEHKMWVLLCEKDGVLCNALVLSPGGETGVYLLAATTNAGLETDGSFLLQWEAIQLLKSRGFRWYDLGGVNPEKNPGVYQFKKGLGGALVKQLGVYEFCGSWGSSAAIRMIESLRTVRRHFGFRTRTRSPEKSLTSPASA